MNNTSLPCSLNDTTELRNLILENPDLPLLIFAGDGAWCECTNCGEEVELDNYEYD